MDLIFTGQLWWLWSLVQTLGVIQRGQVLSSLFLNASSSEAVTAAPGRLVHSSSSCFPGIVGYSTRPVPEMKAVVLFSSSRSWYSLVSILVSVGQMFLLRSL